MLSTDCEKEKAMKVSDIQGQGLAAASGGESGGGWQPNVTEAQFLTTANAGQDEATSTQSWSVGTRNGADTLEDREAVSCKARLALAM